MSEWTKNSYNLLCLFYTTILISRYDSVFSSEKQHFSPLFPGSHCNALSCLSLIYSSGVGRGVLQQQQKWSNTKPQQLKNSPTVTLHLKLADKVETTSVPLAIFAGTSKKKSPKTNQPTKSHTTMKSGMCSPLLPTLANNLN